MIRPNQEFLHRLYTAKDVASLQDKEVTNLEELLANVRDPTPENKEKQKRAYENIRQMAHRRMIRLNLAYEILLKGPQQGSPQSLGYDVVEEHNRYFGSVKAINLECSNARLVYLEELRDFWVKGPHLEFEWGTPQTYWEGPHYDDPYYIFCVPLQHLFAHIELLQERPVSRALLSSLRDVFHLNDDNIQYLQKTISIQKSWGEIERALQMMEFGEYYQRFGEQERRTYHLQFFGQVERIVRGRDLELGFYSVDITQDRDGNTTGIKLGSNTLISEEDYLLLSTLAYGPSLEKKPPPRLPAHVEP